MAALQPLFGSKANELAFTTGFRSRPSPLGGAELAFALVGGWLSNPQASRSELAQLSGVSKQALDQSLGEKAATFLAQLLEWCIAQRIGAAQPTTAELLARFKAVYVMDSSTVSLPPSLKDQWPGCGKAGSGSHSEAGLKLHVALDLVGGELLGPALTSARTHDRAGPHQAYDLEAGSLRLADLGYFNLKRLGELERSGVYFLSKVQTGTQVYRADGTRVGMGQGLAELPAEQSSFDQTLEVGKTERLKCRVVGWRVPNEVSQARQEEFKHLEQKRQRPISGEKLEMSYWTVYLTNVEAAKLSGEEVAVLYRLRWQIELLFKLWKSQCEIDQWQSTKGWAIMCELYAKVIGAVVQHWLVVESGWQEAERSLIKVSRVIRGRAWGWLRHYKDWLKVGPVEQGAVAAELAQLKASLSQGQGCRLDRAKAQPNSFQLVCGPPHLNPLDLN